MKRLLLIPILGYVQAPSEGFIPIPLPVKQIEVEVIQQPDIVKALIQIESSGRDNAHNISEDAVGCLQIRPIMVREVNRILRKHGGTFRFKLEDRWDREKSIEMFHIWREHHHPDSDDETISSCWNGGGKGPKKESTLHYWRKVKNKLNELKS
jgi:hypothetical protein